MEKFLTCNYRVNKNGESIFDTFITDREYTLLNGKEYTATDMILVADDVAEVYFEDKEGNPYVLTQRDVHNFFEDVLPLSDKDEIDETTTNIA